MGSEGDSIVEYLYELGGTRPYKCGYCKSPDTSFTRGVWGFKMTCRDYQVLVDRGFQRSGNFVYKPVMRQTCCPQYVIRMDSRKFKLSKSQKSCIRKFKKYLLEGSTPVPTSGVECSSEGSSEASAAVPDSTPFIGTPIQETHAQDASMSEAKSLSSPTPITPAVKDKKVIRPGLGPDPSKPPCKKAKIVRKERRERKLLAKLQDGNTSLQPSHTQALASASTSQSRQENTTFCQNLEKFLTFPEEEKCVHKFKTKLVKIHSDDFTATYTESFQVFQKFQTIIHKETVEDSSEKQFKEFLVNTPLRHEEGSGSMAIGFGTYHQQYILDDKIFAVGVLDILPKGVLCEYLYYDPDYRFIAPGVITALLEIQLTQQLYLQNPGIQYYYMGFYVQSCPKMNYKSRYSASSLLCPETYTYIPLERCIPKLKASPYCRLAEAEVPDANEQFTEDMLHPIAVFADMTPMTYRTYITLHGDHIQALMKEYVELVGLQLALRMRLYLGRVFV